jgi:S1-C subfamily serine protease
MKNNVRLAALSALLIAAIGLSACASAVPGAAGLIGAVSSARPGAAPAPSLLPPAQGAVAGDLQENLQKVYQEVNPSVVNIRVKVKASDALSQLIPGLPNMPNLPDSPQGDGQLPDLKQLPKELLPFLQPFLDQLIPNQNGQGDDDSQNNDDSQNGDQSQEGPQMPPMNEGLGSGFVWDNEGHIVTNNHVAGDASEIEVTFADGRTVPAELVGADPDSDLAVIKVDPSGLSLQPVLVADSKDVKPGQFVVAIGNPFGLEGSMSFGIVSAMGRSLPANGGKEGMFGLGQSYTIPDIIQTDAPVNPGNSGGVLLDLDGQLIGVPTAIESSSGVSAGIGFAVPSAIVAQVVPELIKDGNFEHPYVGISGTTMNPELAKAMDLPADQRGALVITVAEDGPAAKAGLKASEKTVQLDGRDVQVGGDIIIGIDGQPVKRFDDVVTYLARSAKVGQMVELRIVRDGKEQRVNLTLAQRPSPEARAAAAAAAQEPQAPQQTPAQPEPAQPAPATGSAWLGINGVTLTRDLNALLGLLPREKGVLVASVAEGSPASKAGLRGGDTTKQLNGQDILVGGDVIVTAGDQDITSIEQLAQLVRSQKAGDELRLLILRNGEEKDITATLAARPANP